MGKGAGWSIREQVRLTLLRDPERSVLVLGIDLCRLGAALEQDERHAVHGAIPMLDVRRDLQATKRLYVAGCPVH